MIVRLVGAGHVPADSSAVALGVILVLDAHGAPEHGDGEAGDVAGGEHVFAAVDTASVVDHDAVRDWQADGLRELDSGLDPESGDDRIRLAHATVSRRHPHLVGVPFDRGHGCAGEHLDPVRAVVVGQEGG